MSIEDAKQLLIIHKIGKGCKKSYSSNKIFINYPIHKFLNGTFQRESTLVKTLFDTRIDISRLGNTRGINIWL